jgi:ornithine carbamoyltransferase
MMARHFITFRDFSKEEYDFLLERTRYLKSERRNHKYLRPCLGGRSIAVIFSKSSTRTRVSFECAIRELGGHPVTFNMGDSQWAKGEPLSHTARVLGRYVAGIVIRHYEEKDLTELSLWSPVPVINALTNERHPCQVLGDIFTVSETLGSGKKLEDQTVAWIGDGFNMANTWIEAAGVLGFPLNLSIPEGYLPDKDITEKAQKDNPKIKFFENPEDAVKGAYVVTTDVFSSMGQDEADRDKKKLAFQKHRVTKELMAKALPDAIFLHCLPARPGEEVTDEVLESPASLIFEEAENRLHVQKAILEYLIPAL